MHLRHVLQLSPSNLETMEDLVKIYRRMGDEEMASKYEKKIEVVKGNIQLAKAENAAAETAAAAAPGLLN